MADDIDIEEHDLLEDPKIRGMFPDLTIVKGEPTSDPEVQQMDYNNAEEEYSLDNDNHFVENEHLQYHEEYLEFSGDDDVEEEENLDCLLEDHIQLPTASSYLPTVTEFLPNKIILGSKKAKTAKENLNAVVVLEDWASILVNNPCYCPDCEILFPTQNSLDSHNMTAHSFLVAVSTPKALKSTSRKMETARKSTTKGKATARKSTTFNASKFCNHCNQTFPDAASLIKHLYDTLMPTATAPQQIFGETILSCKICRCVFKMRSTFDEHCRVLHNAIAEPLVVPFDLRCPYCQIILSTNPSFNAHIMKFHFKRKPEQAKVKPKMQDKVANSCKPTRCIKCAKVFPSYKAAYSHRRRAHPEIRNEILVSTETKIKPGMKIPQLINVPQMKMPLTQTLIPKSVLFKCNKCPLHYLSCFGAVCHTKRCTGSASNTEYKCHKCKRVIRAADRMSHDLQHQHGNKLKVYVVHDDMNHKILCKCPDCLIYFEELKFFGHRNSASCGRDSSYKCTECDLDIFKGHEKSHEAKHSVEKYTRDDFITIELMMANKLKRKLDAEEHEPCKKVAVVTKPVVTKPVIVKKPPSQIVKKTPLIKIYYCRHCKNCMHLVKDTHKMGKCQTKGLICKGCGLKFTNKSLIGHYEKCHKQADMDVKNFLFCDVKEKRIDPPIPAYPFCKKCKMRFARRLALRSHDCKTDKIKAITCQVCNLKFSPFAFKIHAPLHSKWKPGKSEPSIKTEKSEESVMPELLKKYKALQKTWHILFRCVACSVVTDTYDSAVDHCHDHFESLELEKLNCEVCKLKFDKQSYQRHLKLHLNAEVSKDSFSYIKYNYKTLNTRAWMVAFSKLPKPQLQQIMFRSVYKYHCSVRMRIIQEGPIQGTLYRCNACSLHFSKSGVGDHLKQPCPSQCFPCQECGLKFAYRYAKKYHRTFHKDEDKKNIYSSIKSFRIVEVAKNPFDPNAKALPVTSISLKIYKCECGMHFTEQNKLASHTRRCMNEKVTDRKTKYSNDLYQCRRCKVCFMNKASMWSHIPRCRDDNYKGVNCKCGYAIHETTWQLHRDEFKNCEMVKFNVSTFGNDTSNTIEIKTEPMDIQDIKEEVEKSDEKSDPTRIIFRCSICDVHYMSERALDYHFGTKHLMKNTSAVACDKCGLRWTTRSMVSHTQVHHNRKKFTKDDYTIVSMSGSNCVVSESHNDRQSTNHENTRPTEKMKTVSPKIKEEFCETTPVKKVAGPTLFKCPICECHFIFEYQLTRHMEENDHFIKTQQCENCDLKFSFNYYPRHLILHHKNMQLGKEDFDVQTLPHLGKREKRDRRSLNTSQPESQTLDLEKCLGNNILLKCKTCNFHMLTLNGLTYHYKLNHTTKVAPEVCPHCHLLFSQRTLAYHISISHVKTQTSIDEFYIVEFDKKPESVIEFNTIVNACLESKSTVTGPKVTDKTSKVDPESSTKERDNDISGRVKEEKRGIGQKRPNLDPVHKLYRCANCDVHFLSSSSINMHFEMEHKTNLGVKMCTECGLTFCSPVIKKHMLLHHENGNNMRVEDYEIESIDEDSRYQSPSAPETSPPKIDASIYDNKLYKCNVCSAHFVKNGCYYRHMKRGIHEIMDLEKCSICHLKFEFANVAKHEYVHHEIKKLSLDDFEIITPSRNKNETVTSTDFKDEVKESGDVVTIPSPRIEPKKYTVKLYKCAPCNVCYLSQSSCFKHVTNHVPMDTLEYIACKACGLQFSYTNLAVHVKKHHKSEFKLEEVLLEEYTPGEDKKKCPKIDIYYASDRMRTGLVSTTSEIKVESSECKNMVHPETIVSATADTTNENDNMDEISNSEITNAKINSDATDVNVERSNCGISVAKTNAEVTYGINENSKCEVSNAICNSEVTEASDAKSKSQVADGIDEKPKPVISDVTSNSRITNVSDGKTNSKLTDVNEEKSKTGNSDSASYSEITDSIDTEINCEITGATDAESNCKTTDVNDEIDDLASSSKLTDVSDKKFKGEVSDAASNCEEAVANDEKPHSVIDTEMNFVVTDGIDAEFNCEESEKLNCGLTAIVEDNCDKNNSNPKCNLNLVDIDANSEVTDDNINESVEMTDQT